MRGLLLFGLVMVLSVTAADDARADDAEQLALPANAESHEHLTKGARLANRMHDYRAALDEYKAGVLIEDSPTFSYNIAQAYRKLNECDKSIWNYERFLSRADPLPRNFKILAEQGIAECRTILARAKLEAGTKPSPTVIVQSRPDPWYDDPPGWVGVGVGTVAVTAAGLLFVQAKDLDDNANREPSPTQQMSLRDSADSRRLAGEIIGITGVLVLGAGIVKLAVTPSARTDATALRLGVTSNGLFVAGQF